MEDVRGQLAVGILSEVLRHAAFLRESGRLAIASERNRGWVVVRDGRPVHAVCRRPDGGPANGLEALATMLAWSDGEYAFEVVPSERPRDAGGVPADAFLDAEDGPRTLSGDAETVLREARAYSGHRNGRLADVRPRFASVASAPVARPAAKRAGNGSTDALERAHGAGSGSGAVPNDDPVLSGASGSHATAFGPAEDPIPTPVVTAAPRAVATHGLRGSTVLKRVDGGDPEERIAVSRGALELWRHLDGANPLDAWSAELGQDRAVLVRRAEELIRVDLAVAEPEPVYGQAFVAGLTDALNEIMGPMGEIVVQDALAELELEHGAIPMDRVDELVSALSAHLHRSDWQLKLRARVARLRAETMETRTEASP